MGDDSTATVYRNCLIGIVSILLTLLITLLGAMWWEIDANGDMIRDIKQDFEHWTEGGG